MPARATASHILLSHGGGGLLTRDLIRDVMVRHLDNPILRELGDSAVLRQPEGRLAFTTDGFVVKPPVFPGGDIGRLAVCGTVNDLAMAGARPLALSLSLILEEGFPIALLETLMASVRRAADEAGTVVATGDTKVVERGAADGIFITTAGVGVVPEGRDLSPKRIRIGDAILVNGSVGDHGIAVLSQRDGLRFGTPVVSDVAPLNTLVECAFSTGASIRCLRDATRGGLGTVLAEFAVEAGRDIRLAERAIPVQDAVRGACEMLGIDPLYSANEGKCVLVCAPDDADGILAAWRAHPLGRAAARIGEVTAGDAGRVTLETRLGGERLIDVPAGEELPRIC